MIILSLAPMSATLRPLKIAQGKRHVCSVQYLRVIRIRTHPSLPLSSYAAIFVDEWKLFRILALFNAPGWEVWLNNLCDLLSERHDIPRPVQVDDEQPPKAFRLEVAVHVSPAAHRTPPEHQVGRSQDMADFRSRRIRCVTTMRSINLHFTYLLFTYLRRWSFRWPVLFYFWIISNLITISVLQA